MHLLYTVLGNLVWGKDAVIVDLRSLLYEGGSSKGQDDVKGLAVYLPVWKAMKKVAWLRSRQRQKRNSDEINYIE